jgi:glycopeptide antibiotics resistance protein
LTDQSKYKKLMIVADILSLIFIGNMLIAWRWRFYNPEPVVADVIPCTIGFLWLYFRYGIIASNKYPFVRALIRNQKFQVLLGVLTFYLALCLLYTPRM